MNQHAISRYAGDAWYAVPRQHAAALLASHALDVVGHERGRTVVHIPATSRHELREALERANASLEADDVAAALREAFHVHPGRRADEAAGPPWEAWFQKWHPLHEVEEELRMLALSMDRAELVSIGTSAEGRNIRALRVRANSMHAPTIVINGGIHAREWISTSTLMYVAEWLNSRDDEILTRRANWILIPVLNVDGYEYTWTDDRLWRKNRQHVGDEECVGIDLNRNAPVAWELSESDVCSNTFGGYRALDAVETKALRTYLEELFDVALFIDVHAAAQMVLSPYAYSLEAPRATDALRAARELVANAMNGVASHSQRSLYAQGRAAVMMSGELPGCIFDDAHKNLGIPLSFAIELRAHHHFRQPASLGVQCGREFVAGLGALLPSIVPRGGDHTEYTYIFFAAMIVAIALVLCVAVVGWRFRRRVAAVRQAQLSASTEQELEGCVATYAAYETDDEGLAVPSPS